MYICSHEIADQFYLQSDDTTIIMHADAAGVYYLYTGALEVGCHKIQTSEIQIFFNSDGTIKSVCPSQSASIDSKDKKASF